MSELQHPEEAIFIAAVQLPAGQRAGYLDGTCGKDVRLRQRVEALLLAHEKAGAFLVQPAAGAPSPPDVPPPKPAATILISLPSVERAGDKIGRYKLLQQIGEGGCGVVYMAEQEEPVRRRVALKVIKLGMDTKQVIARFEAERQALALMDHPNIAKVLDAGTTERGRPFFVMELVRGIKITDYCDQNHLTTERRLDLFVKVCHAIQHAHQKGVIHRDIKPSNILVTMHDGVPMPKVIDFGIAKATDQRLTDKTLFTAFEQFIGTPAYMSPEQAEMTALDIDTRSDVYSLGVLLYELLTGQTPFDPKELLAGGLEEMRRTIREKEPSRPSTRLSTMLDADLMAAAKHRQSDPNKLTGLIRGDLDWIVMKALEKDRTRRYETANGLAMDVQRYLQNEPVVARPPSRLYQFQKLARRHRGVFAAVILVLAALLLGLSASTYLLVREREARRRATAAEETARSLLVREQDARQRAVAAEENAKTAASESDHVAAFLEDMLNGVGPEANNGRDTVLLREILDETAAKLGTELKDEPKVESKLQATIAKVYYDLGEFTQAEAMQRRALALANELFGPASTNSATPLWALAGTLRDEGKLPEAEKLFNQELAIEKKAGNETSLETAAAFNDLGLVLWYRGDLAQAEEMERQGLELRQKLLKGDEYHMAESLGNLGLVREARGKFTQAEENFRAELELANGRQGGGWEEVKFTTLNNLGLVFISQGKFSKAEEAYRTIAQGLERIAPHHPRLALARSHLVVVLQCRAALTDDLALWREALELDPADVLTAEALASLFARPSLIPVTSDMPAPWHYTEAAPDPSWTASDFSVEGWHVFPAPQGVSAYPLRSERYIPNYTNLWLRREFYVTNLPAGKWVLRVHHNQDAEVFLNGVSITPAVDWSDGNRLVPCFAKAQPALKLGRNVLALHCHQADGGTMLDAGLYVTPDETLGRKQLIETFDSMIEKEPNRAELFAGRANAWARLGHWKEAASDLRHAIDLRPGAQDYYCQLATLLVQMGRFEDYQSLRQKALAEFGVPDSPSAGEPVAKLCLLAEVDSSTLAAAAKLAADASGPGYAYMTLARRQWTEGLAEYRQGRYESAIAWMNKARETGARRDLPAWNHERERNRSAGACLVQAMAEQQLRQSEEARAALAEADEIIDTQSPQAGSGDIGREWWEWLTVRILRGEASRLIEGKSTAAQIR